MRSVGDILLEAATPGAALKGVYELRKAESPKLTLGALCKRAGMPSTGYVADVFGGRRKLTPRYWAPLLIALGLEGVAAEFLTLRLTIEQTPALGEDAATKTRLQTLAKLVGARAAPLPARVRQLFFAFEVFAAFGLFRNAPTKADLRQYFGAARGVELDVALHTLKALGLVDGDAGGYRLLADHVNFSESEDGLSHLDFLRLAMQDAEEKVRRWYGERRRAYFVSSILSVRRAAFEKALPLVKDRLSAIEAELESGDADELLRFNVQIYPID